MAPVQYIDGLGSVLFLPLGRVKQYGEGRLLKIFFFILEGLLCF
jgi:hypothetical protein